MSNRFAPEYVDVAARIAEFREKHPDGCLRPVDPFEPFRVIEIAGATFIAYTAAAYRTPDDKCPGVGCAYEPFPGKTNFTRDSELQNAETSAWGRAIVAVLAADTRKGIASADEVRNRSSASDESASDQATAAQVKAVQRLIDERDVSEVKDLPGDVGALSKRDASRWIDRLKTLPTLPKPQRGATVAVARGVATGDGATREEPIGAHADSFVSGPDQRAGEDAAPAPATPGADASKGVPSSSPDALPPVSDAEAALATAPCALCGSTRTKRTTVGDTVRCQDANGCAKRVEDKAHACAGCGEPLSGTVDTIDGRDYHRDCKPW